MIAGAYMESEYANFGVGTALIDLNAYRSSDAVAVYYKTGDSIANCAADSWHLYDSGFSSLGYVQIRLESTLGDDVVYEDFTTWSETDEGSDLSVAENTITITDLLSRDEDSFVEKDFGADYFSGDFEVWIDVNMSKAEIGSVTGIFELSNYQGNTRQARIQFSTDIAVSFGNVDGSTPNISIKQQIGNDIINDITTETLSLSTDYYLKIVRDESVGDYGTATVYVYSDSNRSTLVDSVSITLYHRIAYRYVHVAASYDDGYNALKSSGTISNLLIVSNTETAYPELYQDLLTYTTVDPESNLTVPLAGGSVRYDGPTRTETTYIYKDFGAGAFSGDFEIQVDVEHGSINENGIFNYFGLSNTIGDASDIKDASGDALLSRFSYNPTDGLYINCGESYGGNNYFGDKITISGSGTLYYITIIRDETAGELYTYIYSDMFRTSLVGTSTYTLSGATDFRYLYCVLTYDSGLSATPGTAGEVRVKNFSIISNE